MSLTQVWGSLLIFILCPLLGGLPLIDWLVRAIAGKQLAELGSGNVSVSAAFYHGGRWLGLLAVLSEALKGISVVLLARHFFPDDPAWELIALISLVMGRYWFSRGAGTTNAMWGYAAHDWIAAGLVLLIGGVSFTILRQRKQGRLGILILLPIVLFLRHPQDDQRILMAMALSGLLAWIYTKIPDDLDLDSTQANEESQTLFRFFRGDRALLTLDRQLDAQKVGHKAATLSQLKRWDYKVPPGWVLPPGDDAIPLVEHLHPSPRNPLVVRSSAIGEDSDTASAAGQYATYLDIFCRPALEEAIKKCRDSYNRPNAVQYRRDRGVADAAMAVLVQIQVRGIFSGVAFSRDPIARQGDDVLIEVLPGDATQVVSGQVTPQEYRIPIRDAASAEEKNGGVGDWGSEGVENSTSPSSQSPERAIAPTTQNSKLKAQNFSITPPPNLLQSVAKLARELEHRYLGVPQDVEWSFDGETLWVLQTRPITTLQPIWTRKIAAEVIPGVIPPLTWSINRPLTCGVWGDLFSLVLGKRAKGLDFLQTATLYHGRAYFNASLLGNIFRRMGLPAESLEFLTRGAKFSKPSFTSTLQNVPGLLRLLRRELLLPEEFERDNRQQFVPLLARLSRDSVLASEASQTHSPEDLLARIDAILNCLNRATYYSILAPLSLALRQAMLGVGDGELDSSPLPEVASLRSLQELAAATHHLISDRDREVVRPTESSNASPQLFAWLAEHTDGQPILEQFEQFLLRYGYLSEVATDIAVPTWRENPHPVRELLAQYFFNPPPAGTSPASQSWKASIVQQRLRLKGRVTEVYSRLLAELRWSVLALETQWLEEDWLSQPGDIFFLELPEIRQLVAGIEEERDRIAQVIADRKAQLDQYRQIQTVPALFYGIDPPAPSFIAVTATVPAKAGVCLSGIGASPGNIEGQIAIVHNLQAIPEIDLDTILVVPYTDSGWAPLLARAAGLIAEVGGRLSHGAIVAREYGIPAVMDVRNATQLLKDGQRVRLDGERGTVELL